MQMDEATAAEPIDEAAMAMQIDGAAMQADGVAHVGGSGGGSVCGSSSSATTGGAGGPVRHKPSRRGLDAARTNRTVASGGTDSGASATAGSGYWLARCP